jgi:hypothetical protein
MRRNILLIALGALLASCNGPWNTSVDDAEVPLNVRVGGILVAGMPFDTVWLDRTQKFQYTYDSTVAFIDTAASTVLVRRLDADQVVAYRMADGNRRAWIPVDTAARVALGARYRLEADLRWNASRDFPAATEWRTSKLTAETYTPRSYDIADTLAAPIEALVPFLADGVTADEAALFRNDPDSARKLFASYSLFPALSNGDLQRVADGLPVWKMARTGDTVWALGDRTKVLDEKGQEVQRAFRVYGLLQRVDAERFGGLLAIQQFDTAGERLLNPVTQAALEATGRTDPELPGYYQPGNTRTLLLYGKFQPETPMYPDTLLFTSVYLGYTGRSVQRFYSLDSLYIEYYRTNGDELKPSSYSNVRGGEGYFAGAAVDSLVLHVRKPEGLKGYPVQQLRRAWCERGRDKAFKDGTEWVPGPLCEDLNLDPNQYTGRDKGGGPFGG